MCIRIEKLAADKYSVDGHLVYKDQNGNWIGSPEMNHRQKDAFQKHIAAVENYGLTNEKATYTY